MNSDYIDLSRKLNSISSAAKFHPAISTSASIAQAFSNINSRNNFHNSLSTAITGMSPLQHIHNVFSKPAVHSFRSLGESIAIGASAYNLLSKPIYRDWAYQRNLVNVIASQQAIIGNFSSVIGTYKNYKSIFHQLEGLTTIIGNSFPRAAILAASEDDDEAIGVIEDVSHQVAAVTSSISQRGYIVAEDIGVFRKFIEEIKAVPKADMQWFISILISILLYLMSYYFPAPSGNNDTVKDALTQSLLITAIVDLKASQADYSIKKRLSRNLPLKSRSDANSYTLQVIERNTTVSILDVQGNWCYVTYQTKENLPACGWIESKYFAKEVFSKSFIERKSQNALR